MSCPGRARGPRSVGGGGEEKGSPSRLRERLLLRHLLLSAVYCLPEAGVSTTEFLTRSPDPHREAPPGLTLAVFIRRLRGGQVITPATPARVRYFRE